MKVTREGTGFRPVIIRLESFEEVVAIYNALIICPIFAGDPRVDCERAEIVNTLYENLRGVK